MAALASVALAGCASPELQEQADTSSAHSLSPAADVVYKCLSDKGWEVSISWDGGIEATGDDVPDAQRDLFEADSDECWGVIDERVQAMAPDAISKVYDQELATRDCLIAHGLNVDSPPSRQQYIDTFHGERWMAYSASDVDTIAQDPEAWQKLSEDCPQPSWALGAEQ